MNKQPFEMFKNETTSAGTHVPSEIVEGMIDLLQANSAYFSKQEMELASPILRKLSDILDMIEVSESRGDDEAASDLCIEAQDLMCNLAPPGYTFGTHPGDGALFGFWSVEDETP